MSSASYYEQYKVWERTFWDDPFWAHKARIMTAMIPSGVQTILDVGCGNGAMTNFLAGTYKVCGIDKSETALRYVTPRRICGESCRIPLKSATFDLVLCSEILEHLPDRVYTDTITEIKRMSSGYILLSVPFKENIRFRLIKCPRCKSVFHVWGHVRQFDLSLICKTFSEYCVINWTHCGVYSRDYHPLLLMIRQRIGGKWFQEAENYPLCPGCNNTEFPAQADSFVSRICDDLNAQLGHRIAKTPYWLVVLLNKR